MTDRIGVRQKQTAAIGILGAGLSGIGMGMQLKARGIDDFVIYEKQPDVGGTWLRNTYPGLHCDVPSHLYAYTIAPNPDWSTKYASQPEIQAYIRGCAERHDILRHIRFNADMVTARYDSTGGVWNLEDATGASAQHRLLIAATGRLTEPNIPDIKGLDMFAGPTWHSGAWRDDVDLAGKRVAVVGTAASAVQVVPEVARRAPEVVVFQRSPNWVMPRNNRTTPAAKRDILQQSEAWRGEWRRLYRRTATMFRTTRRMPSAIEAIRQVGLKHMRSAISDPALMDALTPDFDPGCKRVVVSDDYYPALAADHVRLVTRAVKALTETAVVAVDDSTEEADVVIFCTGYQIGARAEGEPSIDVFGRDDVRLSTVLEHKPEAYRGVAIPGFPNYFTVCGLNGVAAYTSLFASSEIASGYIADCAAEIIDKHVRSVEVREEPTREYNRGIQASLQTMSWATGQCTNFYRDNTGRVVAFYPYSLGRMRRDLKRVGLSDFTVERSRRETANE
jgi:cation diffusion facilitator CzcD-associated flavoprotein CzcO